ncbi:MAG TPA: GNAT family N-acetyltransferase [Flavobacteriales bacterium]|nr:GNAT family N-acetyltransferase [Flavobacteriales bacterium]
MIRLIEPRDAEACFEIYRPYVEKTLISFEYEAPSVEEWMKRVETNSKEYPWLVCEYKGEVIGYAYGSKHRYRTAYSWSAESTIYLKENFHTKGIGKILYTTLFELMKLQGYVNVFAGVAMPNEKSENFHKDCGFYEIGIFKKIGYKFGAWHDTKWFELNINEHATVPAVIKQTKEMKDSPSFKLVLEIANTNANKTLLAMQL